MNILLTYAGRIVTIVLAIAILRRLVKIMMEEKNKDEENKKTKTNDERQKTSATRSTFTHTQS